MYRGMGRGSGGTRADGTGACAGIRRGLAVPGSAEVLSPLRPREFFSRPWSGAGELVPRLLPARRTRRFRFRSECEFLHDEEWIVHDAMQFEDGETSVRTMRARLVAPDRIEAT